MRLIEKPSPDEYAPYVARYIDLVPDDGRVLEHLLQSLETTGVLLRSLPEERLLHRYAAGKWTIKEIVQHVTDDERIYAYRALRFARDDATELPGFEQDDYARTSRANDRRLGDLLDELAAVRAATISLYLGLPDESLQRRGVASGNVMSVRAIAYHMAGHELRHMNIIRERYV